MNKDLIPVIAIGGALGIIVYLSSKNQNKADEVYMPYGWGSFNNSNNPLQPIQTTPTPTIPEPQKPIVLPYKPPSKPPKVPTLPYMPMPLPDGDTSRRSGSDNAIVLPYFKPSITPITPTPLPISITPIPIEIKPSIPFKPLSPTAVRDTIKPVTGKKVI